MAGVGNWELGTGNLESDYRYSCMRVFVIRKVRFGQLVVRPSLDTFRQGGILGNRKQTKATGCRVVPGIRTYRDTIGAMVEILKNHPRCQFGGDSSLRYY